jgi:preprotein translocase subunit Sec61beta
VVDDLPSKAKRSSRKGRRKKETSGPMTAAGLVRFFDDVDAKVKIGANTVVWISVGFAITVALLSYVTAVR